MTNDLLKHKLELPPHTRSKLDAYRKRVWAIKLIEGLCAGAFGLLVSYLIVFVCDRFVDTPSGLRTLVLIVGAAGFGIWFPLKCHRWIWRTRRFDQLARLLRHRLPRLSDRMLGIIELAQSDLEQQRSAALCEAALQQVDKDIRGQSFDDAVPNARHRAWIWAAAAPCALAIIALLLVPAAGLNAFQRWLSPWSSTERYTFAQLDDLPERLVVPYSERFDLTAAIAAGSAWSPDTAVARIGNQPAVETRREENAYHFELPAQKQDGEISLTVGDARRKIPVEPKLRPELVELVANIKLPDYLGYASSLTKDARGGSLSVVRGSQATLLAKASRDLVSASVDGVAQPVVSGSMRSSGTQLEDSGILELSWFDEYGLTAKQPFQLKIQANDDQPPTIFCSELRRQQVVLVDQVLTFEVSADDDFGLKEIGIEWQGLEDVLTNPEPARGATVIKAGTPESPELTVQASFCAAREGIAPQTLLVRLFTVDYLPDRERVYSQPYTLFVLSPEDHANWLAEQLRRWSRKAQEVYERENQLYEDNKALRRLSPQELNKKETRQRIETQAAAEHANARELAAVSASGKQLIQEAVKNDQFNVMTMEGLAEMVRTLDEMASNRMPSIADLLKIAAYAPDHRQPAEADQESTGDQQSPPAVGNNRDPNNTSGSKADSDENKDPSKSVPSISDIESSMNGPDDDAEEDEDAKKPPSGGAAKFGLPTTTVLGGGVKQKAEKQEQKDVKEALEEAIDEQENLLEEFAKVAEELQRILDNLEGSTFVKRFKAASRRQTQVANDLNDTLSEKFGRRLNQLLPEQLESSSELAERERAERDNLVTVHQDLEAYYNRVQQGKFLAVINEMNELSVSSKLETLATLVDDNLHGQSIAHAEFWADTFDRWAEQLVGPGCPDGGTDPGSKGGNLSPSIVLDVMKILEKEIGLRDETRAAEQAREAQSSEDYLDRARSLAQTQRDIGTMTAETIDAITELEQEKGLSFPKEVGLLRGVGAIMSEVEALLLQPNTGPEAIAAETEIIELLLQAQRKQPPKKNSKGGSGTNPNGGGEGDTDESALALLGRGNESNAQTIERATEQATGTVGAGYPAEYRAGLDAYFGELER